MSAWGSSWGRAWGFSWGSLGKVGGDDVPRKNPNKGFRLDEWKKRNKVDEDIESSLKQAYRELSGSEEAEEILAPYKSEPQKSTEKTREPGIDWKALAADMEAVERLFQMQMDAQRDEEEAVMVLLQ